LYKQWARLRSWGAAPRRGSVVANPYASVWIALAVLPEGALPAALVTSAHHPITLPRQSPPPVRRPRSAILRQPIQTGTERSSIKAVTQANAPSPKSPRGEEPRRRAINGRWRTCRNWTLGSLVRQTSAAPSRTCERSQEVPSAHFTRQIRWPPSKVATPKDLRRRHFVFGSLGPGAR